MQNVLKASARCRLAAIRSSEPGRRKFPTNAEDVDMVHIPSEVNAMYATYTDAQIVTAEVRYFQGVH